MRKISWYQTQNEWKAQREVVRGCQPCSRDIDAKRKYIFHFQDRQIWWLSQGWSYQHWYIKAFVYERFVIDSPGDLPKTMLITQESQRAEAEEPWPGGCFWATFPPNGDSGLICWAARGRCTRSWSVRWLSLGLRTRVQRWRIILSTLTLPVSGSHSSRIMRCTGKSNLMWF